MSPVIIGVMTGLIPLTGKIMKRDDRADSYNRDRRGGYLLLPRGCGVSPRAYVFYLGFHEGISRRGELQCRVIFAAEHCNRKYVRRRWALVEAQKCKCD
jgi:hypothetical protein